jgi:ornithine cyclodeaminase
MDLIRNSTLVLSEKQIRALVGPEAALAAVRDGFRKLAHGEATLPGVIGFEVGSERGEVHVKAAYLHDSPYYSVKIASGFYANTSHGMPAGNGLVAVFDAQTGETRALLLDNGYLTELRTGAAGGLVADLLARHDSQRVAMIGCGSQARYQLESLRLVRDIREVMVYGRCERRAREYATEMTNRFGITVRIAGSVREAIQGADIVVTTTPAREPIVQADWITPGMHVTAMGSDGPGKQELDTGVLAKADRIVVDRRDQCLHYGEMQHASAIGLLPERIHAEVGELAAGLKPGRLSAEEITVADLTGVGVQDAAIANLVLARAMQTQSDRSEHRAD